jgi:archaellum biogenesis ATPase FlaH
MSDITTYDQEAQMLFIRFLVSDSDLFARCQNIIRPDFFDQKFRKAVKFLVSYSLEYSTLPGLDQLEAVSGLVVKPIDHIREEHQNWFLKEFETFCRHRAIDSAIVRSAELLEKKHYGDVENLIKEAVQIGLVKDLGLNYFEDPAARLERIRSKGGAIPTGWQELDFKLYGGLNRGEITIFAGGSGAGKSLWLQNFAVNWISAGLNVIYISLELDEDLISKRIDSMITDIPAKDIMKNINDVALKLAMFSKKHKPGVFQLKQMPSGVNVNDLRSYIREVEIQLDIRFDVLLVDYLDLMMPISTKISPSDLFVKDKYVTEELRNLAGERNMLCVTASQLNRAAVEQIEFDHSHISGGLSKIQTADNVMGIFTTNSMRDHGRYQIQLMKTRSSAGLGSKIDFMFNVDTLRITDLPKDQYGAVSNTTQGVIDKLQRKNVVDATQPSKVGASVPPGNAALNLRDMLRANNGK